ncbi:MAG: hypothetical protein AAFO91_12170, partial [Bacteroidota bacterium]
MVRTRSFDIKNGYCLLYSDRIELQYKGLRGWWLRWMSGRGWRSEGLLYLLLSIVFALLALTAVIIENYFLALFFVVFCGVTVVALFQRQQYAFSVVIPRSEIESVAFREAVKGVSRAKFIVQFRPKKRLYLREILLPSLLQ